MKAFGMCNLSICIRTTIVKCNRLRASLEGAAKSRVDRITLRNGAGRFPFRNQRALEQQLADGTNGRYYPHMTVALAKDVEDFLEDQVRSGVCADASELVNDVIRSV